MKVDERQQSMTSNNRLTSMTGMKENGLFRADGHRNVKKNKKVHNFLNLALIISGHILSTCIDLVRLSHRGSCINAGAYMYTLRDRQGFDNVLNDLVSYKYLRRFRGRTVV